VRWSVAAGRLLDAVGYRPPGLAERWKQATTPPDPPDVTMLAEALKTFCRRTDPRWRHRQFDAPVAAALTRCLGLLDLVHTAPDAAAWLAGCKQVMTGILRTSDEAKAQSE
jgi:hypothetical protein